MLLVISLSRIVESAYIPLFRERNKVNNSGIFCNELDSIIFYIGNQEELFIHWSYQKLVFCLFQIIQVLPF